MSRGRTFVLVFGALGWLGCHGPEEGHHAPWDGEHDPPPEALVADVAHAMSTRPGPDGESFGVELRTPDMVHYPCASCHEDANGRPVSLPVGGDRDAHADIRPVHPSELVEDCTACHNPADYETLALQDGGAVGFDEAYTLCAQCHFEQGVDWAGGAHGKRVTGWNRERVARSCTGCHDPHAPAFESRQPDRGPTIPRTGGRGR